MKLSNLIAFATLAIWTSCGDARVPSESAAAQAAQMDALAHCRAITDDPGRLACYDQAVGELLNAAQKADIIVLDRKEVETARRSLFGFTLPDLSLFRHHGANIEQLDHVEGLIASTSQDVSGQWTFRLQDGAIWRQIDTNEVTRSPRSGDPVVIKRAALGSYILSVAKTPGVRVRRIG